MGITAMIASIKFNDRRYKREAFNHISGNTDTKSNGIKIEPISEESLQEIRNKLKKQRIAILKKQVLVFGLLIVMITAVIIYII